MHGASIRIRSVSALAPVLLLLALAAQGQAPGSAAAQSSLPGPPPVAPSPNSCLPGTGSRNWCGDGRLATQAKLAGPWDVTAAPDGTLFVADTVNGVIRRISRDGLIATVAGDGWRDAPQPREPAATASFDRPRGISYDAATNSLLVADTFHDSIRRIAADGTVTTVVGRSAPTLTSLRRPTDVVALPRGGMLVSETVRNRVLRISSSGSVRRIAGTGRRGFSRKTLRGSRSPLSRPAQVVLLARGDVLIADTGNRAIRLLRRGRLRTLAVLPGAPFGVAASGGRVLASQSASVLDVTRRPFVTVAGSGERGFTGDSGPPRETALDLPRQLAAAPDGTLLIAEDGNDRIRRVAVGELVTVAGSDRPVASAAMRGPLARLAHVHPTCEALPGGFPCPVLAAPTARRASGCKRYDKYNPVFTQLELLPPKRATLTRRTRKQVRLRYVTSRVANVAALVSRRRKSFLATQEGVTSEGKHRIVVRGRFRPRRYKVELWARSLPDQVPKCDARRLRFK
jgi:hypothetical protein